jgi:hypothetical protein
MKYLTVFVLGYIIGNTKQSVRKRKIKALVKKVNNVVKFTQENVLH